MFLNIYIFIYFKNIYFYLFFNVSYFEMFRIYLVYHHKKKSLKHILHGFRVYTFWMFFFLKILALMALDIEPIRYVGPWDKIIYVLKLHMKWH